MSIGDLTKKDIQKSLQIHKQTNYIVSITKTTPNDNTTPTIHITNITNKKKK